MPAPVQASLMKNPSQEPIRLINRPHFLVLDGLRGVAAITVLIFHFMEIIVPDPSKSFITHGYLAVDFFFCLSGFVIAYAYDNRIGQSGSWAFFRLRLIRLHPLVVIGALIGLICFVIDPFSKLYVLKGPGKTALMFISGSLMIPYPAVPERYHNLFHLNPPTWSLMWEYIANIVYALILYRISRKTLMGLTIIAAIALCITATVYGNVGVGWGIGNEYGGLPRVAGSFLLGMLVFRSGWRINNALGFVPIAVLLLLAFLVPYRTGLNRYTEPFLVLIYFPFLIALGAGTQTGQFWNGCCKWLGDLSYPLYMVHYPFIWLFMSYLEARKPAAAQLWVLVPILTVALLTFAHLIMTYVDTPIRRYLSGKRIA